MTWLEYLATTKIMQPIKDDTLEKKHRRNRTSTSHQAVEQGTVMRIDPVVPGWCKCGGGRRRMPQKRKATE